MSETHNIELWASLAALVDKFDHQPGPACLVAGSDGRFRLLQVARQPAAKSY